MGHRVTLKPSAHSFEVPEGQSILQAGLDAGFMMPYSCRTGVCRTCRGTLLEGKVDYGAVHPTYLPDSDKAKGYALLCQARPLSDIVVEVHELAGMAGIRPRKIPCRVERIERPAPDVAILNLRLPMNENFRFLAGQYVDFLLKDAKRRSYSIANPPRPEGVTALELHVRHTPGGAFTDQVFSSLKVRDLRQQEVQKSTGLARLHHRRIDARKSVGGFAHGIGQRHAVHDRVINFFPLRGGCGRRGFSAKNHQRAAERYPGRQQARK